MSATSRATTLGLLCFSKLRHELTSNMATLQYKTTGCLGYEDAVRQLSDLQSNPETIVKAREMTEKMGKKTRKNVIPKMINFIERSGLQMEEVDKLPVVHISGSKGKGSTCAYLESIFRCHGYKTGLFTSPHLVEVRDRIRINGRPIGRELFSNYFWQVYNKLKETEIDNPPEEGKGMPGYFPFLTVLCLHVFLSEGVDVAVIEVGIGGEHDRTNFFRKPIVCGVTHLGFDHMSLLGQTIEEIAWHKAGIFKTNCPAVTVNQRDGALQVLLSRAKERKSPLYLSQKMTPEDLSRFSIKLGVPGEQQLENASLAVNLFRLWKRARSPDTNSSQSIVSSDPEKLSNVADIPVLSIAYVEEREKEGLRECMWPGRAQTLKKKGITYYLDGAHTLESSQMCTRWFDKDATEEKEKLKVGVVRVLVFMVTRNRDPKPLLENLKDFNFDAAAFCTHVMSTVKSTNKADYINQNVTVSSMFEKAKNNKLCWDSLTQQKTTDPQRLDSQAEKGNFFDSKIDINERHKHTQLKTELPSPSKKSRQEETVDNGLEPSCIQSATQLARSDQAFSSSTYTSPSVDKNSSKLSSSAQPHVTSQEADSDKIVVHSNSEPCSQAFPCILDALLWVTQRRDPEATSLDTGNVLPAVPQYLREAEHIQVLVTGSIHLVGAVIGVIDSQLKEQLYS